MKQAYSKQQSNDIVATIYEAYDTGAITLHIKQALINLFQIVQRGNPCPSQQHVANKARLSVRVVSEAVKVAKLLGLLVVVPRYRMVSGRPRRAENRHIFMPVKHLPEGIRAYERTRCGPSTKEYIKKKIQPVDNRYQAMGNSWEAQVRARDKALQALMPFIQAENARQLC